jgi:hypothetical protein
MLSSAGSFLERALVDKACGSPERLIFEAPPVIIAPLEQAPRLAVAYEGEVLDTLAACPPLSAAEIDRVEELKEIEKVRLKPESEATRAKWSESHIKRIAATGMPEPWARAQVGRWLDKQELSGDYPLPFDDPKLFGATVDTVLSSPGRFIGMTLADPIEGVAYGKGKAIVYRRENATLFVNSFAHGGATYELKAAPKPDVDAEVERLSPLDFARAKKDAAKRLGISVADLDKAVKAKQRAGQLKPREADAILDELNRDNSVIMIGGRRRVLRFEDTPHIAGGERYILRLPTYVRFDDFTNYYLNRLTFTAAGPVSIGEWWFGHPQRNSYPGVIFLPGGGPVIDGYLNLWIDFGVKPKRGS